MNYSHGIPVANMGTLMDSLQKAVAIKASATTWTMAPTADHRAPRTLGGMGVLASGTAVTTFGIVRIHMSFFGNMIQVYNIESYSTIGIAFH